MSHPGAPLESFPSRPFAVQELTDLAETDRFRATIYDDLTVEVEDTHVHASNCVFVTPDTVSAAVYVDAERTWYRVYSEPREAAELTAAYDAVRAVRDDDALFPRQPLTVSEAVFGADVPSGRETSGYEAGEDFACPVCGEIHTVAFEDNDEQGKVEQDTSVLYVECAAASAGRLYVEMQANTGG